MGSEFGWGFSFIERDEWSKYFYVCPTSSQSYAVEWCPMPDTFLPLVGFDTDADYPIVNKFDHEAKALLKIYEQLEIEKLDN